MNAYYRTPEETWEAALEKFKVILYEEIVPSGAYKRILQKGAAAILEAKAEQAEKCAQSAGCYCACRFCHDQAAQLRITAGWRI